MLVSKIKPCNSTILIPPLNDNIHTNIRGELETEASISRNLQLPKAKIAVAGKWPEKGGFQDTKFTGFWARISKLRRLSRQVAKIMHEQSLISKTVSRSGPAKAEHKDHHKGYQEVPPIPYHHTTLSLEK